MKLQSINVEARTMEDRATPPSASKVSRAANGTFELYKDLSSKGKLLSETKVHYVPAAPSAYTEFKKHKSLEALCKHIASSREPDSGKKLSKAKISKAKYSAVNCGDLETEVHIGSSLRKKLGISSMTKSEIKEFFKTETLYKHNSEFNGHAYKNKDGSYTKIHSAISSSSDREALSVQNLSLVKTGGEKLLYTGRPDSFAKAKEEALFILSHTADIPLLKEVDPSTKLNPNKPKWMDGKKGITWNEEDKCLEFSYSIYSIMTDSSLLSFVHSKICKQPKEDELLFLNQEKEAISRLKSGPIVIQDENGNVFKVQFKPTFFSQGFNSWAAFKGFSGEGRVSAPIMAKGWSELRKRAEFSEKTASISSHVQKLEEYFAGNVHLSNLHLFIHMHLVLSAMNDLPLVLHCKSTIDRTGIGVAILTTLDQMKRLGKSIPDDLHKLTDSEEFKEFFFLNWLPTWNERARSAREHPGICFGLGASRNPVLLECLPKRLLKKSDSNLRFAMSGLLAGINSIGARCKLLWLKITPTFYKDSEEWYARMQYARSQTKETTYYPHMLFSEKIAAFELSRNKPKKHK